jgi:hypothetical protein
MPLAAPLILPFAELAGITIAGLGMAAASKKVSDFISDNPEISTQILTTLVPGGVGLNALFKDKDAPSTKDIVLGELGKEKGNYSSPDAEGAYSSKRGRIIKALEEAGKIKKGPNKDYDSSKKYKGYKKFYEKADGGRIGFANGGRGYSDYASPSSTTASQDFATQAVSGGQTDYDGGGGGNDQPITEIRPNFNYNIDPFSINPRLNFKNIASIIYLQEFLDKKARGEDVDLEADINFRDQLGNLDIFGNLGRSGNIVGANIPFLQSGLASLAYNTDTGLAAGLRGNLTEDLSGGVSFQDGQQNVNFNYNKGPFSADFTSGPEENNIQVGFKMPFADGGRIGYVGGGLATTQDFANALKSVSAGTTYQQQTQAKEYARNEASNLLSQAMRSADPNKGPGLQGIYDTFFKNQNVTGIRPKTFTPDSSGRMIMYSARDRDAILDSMANQMLNTTPYAASKPIPKTYRTVSPEAQALNMSQSTYEDIIRSGADPKQYYMDYQNRIMAGNPNLLKYGQVIGGPGMVIAGPGTAPGATPPTQAQMNQMMQNNPMGYMDFADLVKQYSSTDPYKNFKEEIKDMVDGRDTGYMGGQDYYDINVLGLDGRGIAEKYGLQYADGGRIGFANGGDNIIGADLKDPDTEMNQNTEMNQMISPGGINFSNIKNYASIPATYGAALYGNYINQRVGENMARAFRTDEMNERLSQQVGDKLSPGINSGGLTYTDFGLDPVREYIGGGEYRNTREFNPPSFEKAMSLNSADLANALTLGNLNFNKDPSGNINYTGNTFDFPQPTFMNNNPVDIPLDELNVNAPQFSFTDYLQGNYDLNKSPTTDIVVPERIAPATYYNSAPNFNADVLREEEDAQYNLPQKNMLQNLKDYLPFIGDKSITGMLTRGIGQFFNNIGDRIPSTPQYQRYTPGYNYGNLNPNLIDDFYDPATGLNRFDRAKTLFGQSRTLSEFLSKRRERAAAEADLIQRREIERKIEREKALTRNTSSNIDYGGFVSGGGTHSSDSSFTGHSSATGGGMGQSGWGGPRADGGFIGQYSNGGLATMFRRKQ